MNIAAIVVTYNRNKLLEKCIESLKNQSLPLSKIIIIDNASTDGTEAWFESSCFSHDSIFDYIRLPENTGGAGGFYEGLKYSYAAQYDASWIMDDDALPASNAFEELMKVAVKTDVIYGSIAKDGEETSWNTTLITENSRISTRNLVEIPTEAAVWFLPFLGILIHRNIIENIGYPDPNYFIAGDDFEYCLRAQSKGYKVVVAGKSHISHPKSKSYTVNFGFREVGCLELPPWKRYYDTRNRLLAAKKHFGKRWIIETLPACIFRLIGALIHEPNRMGQAKATFAGMFDGIFNIMGKRHVFWRINP